MAKDLTLTFKDCKVAQEVLLVGIHPLLMDTLLFISEEFGRIPTITSGFRAGDKGVHGTRPWRAVDIRSWGNDFTPEELVDAVNKEFCYDNRRPNFQCALFHDVGRGAHFHLQVHPNTRLRAQVEAEET